MIYDWWFSQYPFVSLISDFYPKCLHTFSDVQGPANAQFQLGQLRSHLTHQQIHSITLLLPRELLEDSRKSMSEIYKDRWIDNVSWIGSWDSFMSWGIEKEKKHVHHIFATHKSHGISLNHSTMSELQGSCLPNIARVTSQASQIIY